MTQTQAIRPSLWWAALAIPFSLAGLGLAAFFMVSEIQRVGASMAFVNVPGEMDVELKKNLSYTVFLEQTSGGGSDSAPIVALKSKVRCELHALPYGDTIPMSAPSGSATYNYGVRSGISFLDFSRCGKPLRLDRQAEVAELIVPLVTNRVIELPVRTDLEPSGNVIVSDWKPGDKIDGIGQRATRRPR